MEFPEFSSKWLLSSTPLLHPAESVKVILNIYPYLFICVFVSGLSFYIDLLLQSKKNENQNVCVSLCNVGHVLFVVYMCVTMCALSLPFRLSPYPIINYD